MSSKVKVAVRVRPFNRRGLFVVHNQIRFLILSLNFPSSDMELHFSTELELGTKVVIDMIEEQTILLSLRGEK